MKANARRNPMIPYLMKQGSMGVCIFFAALSMFLQWNSGVIPLEGPHDSLKYLSMAESISNNRWLGEYDQMTLIRSPVYSIFLALNAAMEWPLQRTQTIVYLLSILLLAAALMTNNIASLRVVSVGLLCSFQPAAWIPCRFVASEALYTPVVTMALAGMIGIIGSVKKSFYLKFFWLICLSISASLAWLVRNESIWLVPSAGVFALILFQKVRSGGRRHKSKLKNETADHRKKEAALRIENRKQWLLGIAAIGLPCLCIFALTACIQQRNLRYYGIPVITELAEPRFCSAFKWLTKLDAETHHPYVPITKKAMAEAFRISPHFKALQPYLSQQTDGAGWSRFGCEYMGICNELAGGWTLWAIRDAAASIGMHDTADKAGRFYGGIAEDLKMGCREGKVRCTRNPTGNMLAPPMKWIDILRILQSGVKVIWMTSWLGDLPESCRLMDNQKPPAQLIERYRTTTGTPGEYRSTFFVDYGGTLSWIFRLIYTIGGFCILVTGIQYGMRRFKKPSSKSPGTDKQKYWMIVLLTVFIISRVAVVSYIDAMSYWAQLRYMLVVYPAFITLICLMLPFPKPRLSNPLSFPKRPDSKESPTTSDG